MGTVARNRKAFRDYDILDTFEVGIVLEGSEVKSVRAGRVSIKDSHARVKNGELWLYGLHISPYEKASAYIPDPRRRRKLLMHKRQILKLKAKTDEKGLTLIPLEIYINGRGLVKIKIGLAKGRKEYQKKRYLLEKQQDRDKERELRDYLKGRRERR